jgi:penicillin amidase
MIWIKASFTLLLTITLVVLLNSKMGSVPPLGKFMNPFGGFWANAEPRNAGKEKKLNLTGLHGEVKAVADGAANTLCGWPRFGDYRGGHR